jgi:cytokinesis protein
LGELKAMLPGREEAGKLGQYRTADDSVLATLHIADRFLVELYRRDKDHLSDRVDGMLYRSSFAENLATHSKNVSAIYKAATAMQSAEHFGQLLRLMLILGNFMNGTGYNGGAFGFKISSINRVRTKQCLPLECRILTSSNSLSTRRPRVVQLCCILSKPL